MAKIVSKRVTNPVGRPPLPPERDGDKIMPNGLTKDMNKRLRDEANIRSISVAQLERQVHQWYFDALDKQRATVDTNEMFDEYVKEEQQNKDKV